MKRVFIIALVTAIILGTTLPMAAEPAKIGTGKLERGGKNIVLGWTEIPNAIVKVTKDTNNPFLGITVGLLKGVLNAFARTASGALDVATFPVDSNKPEPLIKAEMIEVVAEPGATK